MLVSYYLPGKRAPQPHAHLAYGPTLRAVVEELHLTLPHGGWAGGWFWFATTGYDPKMDEQGVFIHCTHKSRMAGRRWLGGLYDTYPMPGLLITWLFFQWVRKCCCCEYCHILTIFQPQVGCPLPCRRVLLRHLLPPDCLHPPGFRCLDASLSHASVQRQSVRKSRCNEDIYVLTWNWSLWRFKLLL